MDANAADDAERQRNRTRLYAPPAAERRRRTRRVGVTATQAQALLAEIQAQDARLSGQGGG